MHIFTYGSLMFEDVWKRVVLGNYENYTGTLFGYRRRCLSEESYPVAFEGSPHERIWGRIYLNVNNEDLARLDVFEGSQYERKSENVELDDGKSINADVYILKTKYYDKIVDTPWDVEWFEHIGMAQFLEKYQGFSEVS
jgi:gamma-glutamylcyclotransferase (GGCT)/AIG2-like uncharacterized protein YtfP